MNGDDTVATDLSSQFAAAATNQTQLNSPPNMGIQQVQLQRNNGANQGQVVMQITNQVDARVIKTISPTLDITRSNQSQAWSRQDNRWTFIAIVQ